MSRKVNLVYYTKYWEVSFPEKDSVVTIEEVYYENFDSSSFSIVNIRERSGREILPHTLPQEQYDQILEMCKESIEEYNK